MSLVVSPSLTFRTEVQLVQMPAKQARGRVAGRMTGRPPSISRAGAGAYTIPSSQVRQAYLGRRVTSTRNCAGTISSRSLLSSPIRPPTYETE